MPDKPPSRAVRMPGFPLIPLFAVAYLVAAFLTGGYYANHRCDDNLACGVTATYAGALWPAYWAARASLEVTK